VATYTVIRVKIHSVEGHAGEEETYDEIAVQPAPGTCLGRSVFEVVDIVIEYDVDTARGNVLLDPLTIFVRIRRVEEHRVRVDNGDLLAGERVHDLSSIF